MTFKQFIGLFIPPIYFKIKYSLKKESVGIGFGSHKPKIIGCGEVKIGKYCSIADDVKIILHGHHPDWVSTYHFGHTTQTFGDNKTPDPCVKGKVVIGNDVWIGYGSLILYGSVIGDGAIIGAGSVVRGKVKPYSVVAGNPAEFVCMRFDKGTIDHLLEVKWWNWERKQINKMYWCLNRTAINLVQTKNK
jgi:lipopolysaccharide transport system ATP-binding protein